MDFSKVIGHEDVISHLRSSIELGRVGHAYIFNGEEGSGRSTLVHSFVKALQCESGESESCGQCKSCKQMEGGNQPDVIYVTHEKDQLISVDEIRTQVVDTMPIKPYSSRYKIYIIKDGDKMNENAQNTLLKTIEEPPEYGIIIIITKNAERLLQTVRSRCVIVNMKPVKEKDIQEYIDEHYDVSPSKAKFAVEYAQGNLGKAIALITNEEYEQLINSVITLEKNIFDMEMEEISEAIQHAANYKMTINEYLDLMMLWYRSEQDSFQG